MVQFYSPEIQSTHTLGPEESLHCVKVLRKKAGDMIYVTDGRGQRYECRILNADHRKVEVEITGSESIAKNWPNRITLAVAPTKNADRMAWLVEKATELGVDEIRFVKCRHSERKTVNADRLRRNAISAMNQSLKVRLPLITEMEPLGSLLELEGEKYFGYCDAGTERLDFVKTLNPEKDVVVAIGPEGDFSVEEVELLKKGGFKAVTFGGERLRTETAGLYAVVAIHIAQDLK